MYEPLIKLGYYVLFNTKPILVEEWFYWTHNKRNKEIHTFPKSISPKVNVIAWPEIELAYFKATVHHFKHYFTGTPPYKNELSFTTYLVISDGMFPIYWPV